MCGYFEEKMCIKVKGSIRNSTYTIDNLINLFCPGRSRTFSFAPFIPLDSEKRTYFYYLIKKCSSLCDVWGSAVYFHSKRNIYKEICRLSNTLRSVNCKWLCQYFFTRIHVRFYMFIQRKHFIASQRA